MNEALKRILRSQSESFRRLNPGLGGLAAGVAKPELGRALEQASSAPEGRPRRVAVGSGPLVRCTFIYCSNSKPLDLANRAHGYKGLQDAIAASLGLDDADSRIDFEYSQVRTRGRRGTIVKMELL